VLISDDGSPDKRVYAGTILRDPDTRRITGVRIGVQLTSGDATISILESPPSVDLSQLDMLRAALDELAAILSEATRKPERILWHFRESD
jgi:hypothetical protein